MNRKKTVVILLPWIDVETIVIKYTQNLSWKTMRPIRCVYSRTNYSNAVCWNNTQTIVSFWMAKQWSPFLSFHFFAIVRRWEIILNKTEFWSSRYDFFVVTTHNWANVHIHRNIFLHKPLRFCVCVQSGREGRLIPDFCSNILASKQRRLFKNFGCGARLLSI